MHGRYLKKIEETSDPEYNLEVKLGLLAWIQYLIEVRLSMTKLPPEEWLKQNESLIRELEV